MKHRLKETVDCNHQPASFHLNVQIQFVEKPEVTRIPKTNQKICMVKDKKNNYTTYNSNTSNIEACLIGFG